MKNSKRTILLALILGISLVPVSFVSADGGCFGGMMSGSYGYFGMWVFGALFYILIIAALVLLIVWLIKQIQIKNKRK